MDFSKRQEVYVSQASTVMWEALNLLPSIYPDAYYLHLYDGKDLGREYPASWEELSPSQRQTRRRHYLNPELPAATYAEEEYPTLIDHYRAIKTTPRQALLRLKEAQEACKNFSTDYSLRGNRYCDLPSYYQQQIITHISALYAATCEAYAVLSDAERVNSGVYSCSVFTPPKYNKNDTINPHRTLNNYLALTVDERAEQNQKMRQTSAKTVDALWEAMPKLEQLLSVCIENTVCKSPLSEVVVGGLPPQLVGKLPPAGQYPVVLHEKALSEIRAALKIEGLPEDRYILDDSKITAHGLKGAQHFALLVQAKTALLTVMTLKEITGELAAKITTDILPNELAFAMDYVDRKYDESYRQYQFVRKTPYMDADTLREALKAYIIEQREGLNLTGKGESNEDYFARFEREARAQAPTLKPMLKEELTRHSLIHTLASKDEARTK